VSALATEFIRAILTDAAPFPSRQPDPPSCEQERNRSNGWQCGPATCAGHPWRSPRRSYNSESKGSRLFVAIFRRHRRPVHNIPSWLQTRAERYHHRGACWVGWINAAIALVHANSTWTCHREGTAVCSNRFTEDHSDNYGSRGDHRIRSWSRPHKCSMSKHFYRPDKHSQEPCHHSPEHTTYPWRGHTAHQFIPPRNLTSRFSREPRLLGLHTAIDTCAVLKYRLRLHVRRREIPTMSGHSQIDGSQGQSEMPRTRPAIVAMLYEGTAR